MKTALSCFFFVGLFASDLNIAPDLSPSEEKGMVVCIASFNNEEYCEENLSSVFSQKYGNFRVIYVDDASTDNTRELVEKFIEERGLEDKITFISNSNNQGAMANLFAMIHSMEDQEIAVTLDGDDFFAHDGVLDRINRAYADTKVWATYGNYLCVPTLEIGHPRPLQKEVLERGGYRKMEFYWSHLRTCYAGLFKKIPKSWFQDKKREFFSTACDVAIMIGLMDLCGSHVHFIPDVLCHYNVGSALNDHKRSRKRQVKVKTAIYKRPPLSKTSCKGSAFGV